MRVGVRELEGRGRGLVATEPIAAGEEVLREPQPVCRAHIAQHLRELQEETALLVSMGYVEFWPHAVKDRRVADACRAAVEAAPAAQRSAFLELEDAFASADGQAGRFLTNNVQLPGSGECAVYALYSRINHSCESNVRVDLGADGALSVVALRDLQVGEEVLDNSSLRRTARTRMPQYGWRCDGTSPSGGGSSARARGASERARCRRGPPPMRDGRDFDICLDTRACSSKDEALSLDVRVFYA